MTIALYLACAKQDLESTVSKVSQRRTDGSVQGAAAVTPEYNEKQDWPRSAIHMHRSRQKLALFHGEHVHVSSIGISICILFGI